MKNICSFLESNKLAIVSNETSAENNSDDTTEEEFEKALVRYLNDQEQDGATDNER